MCVVCVSKASTRRFNYKEKEVLEECCNSTKIALNECSNSTKIALHHDLFLTWRCNLTPQFVELKFARARIVPYVYLLRTHNGCFRAELPDLTFPWCNAKTLCERT